MKSTDRAKFRGYCNQWLDAKYLLGCAVFVDVLTPCAIFSKVMQSNELDILAALTSLLRTIKETDKFSTLPLSKWPVYSAMLKKVVEDNGKKFISVRSSSDSIKHSSTTRGIVKSFVKV